MRQEGATKTKLLNVAVQMIWESSYGSVSVDDICRRADVKKGSFYHAFKSKSDLAVAAVDHYWETKRALLDRVFSVQSPPLQRIENYCDLIIKDQLAKYESFGKLLGCPFCSIGCELSTQDENIRQKIEELSARSMRYIEPTLRDLMETGQIPKGDPHEISQEFYSYLAGVMLQAKIENNPELVRRLRRGVFHLLNLRLEPVAA